MNRICDANSYDQPFVKEIVTDLVALRRCSGFIKSLYQVNWMTINYIRFLVGGDNIRSNGRSFHVTGFLLRMITISKLTYDKLFENCRSLLAQLARFTLLS